MGSPQDIGVNTRLIIEAFERRNWRCERVVGNYFVASKAGESSIPFFSTLNMLNSGIGYEFAQNKALLYELAPHFDWAVPQTVAYTSEHEAEDFLKHHGSIVVKPADTDHGNNVHINITNKEQLMVALESAAKVSKQILLQSFETGDDYRLMVVGDNVVAVTKRVPAFVIGNGIDSINSLISAKNAQQITAKTGKAFEIDLNAVRQYLHDSELRRIPVKGEVVRVVGPSNRSLGGESVDATDLIHESIKQQAVSIARSLSLGVCGVDMIIKNAEKPFSEAGAVLIEVNKMPGVTSHDLQSDGSTRNVADKIVDLLLRKVKAQ